MSEKMPNSSNQAPEDNPWASLMNEEVDQMYDRNPDESQKDYQKRLQFMREKTAEYLDAEAEKEAAKNITDDNGLRTEAYINSEQGQDELSAEAEYYRLAAKLATAVKEGRITDANAQNLLARQKEKLNSHAEASRQDYEDSRAIGTVEEQEAYDNWLKSHDAENMANLEARGALEEDAVKSQEEDAIKSKEEDAIKSKEEDGIKSKEEMERLAQEEHQHAVENLEAEIERQRHEHGQGIDNIGDNIERRRDGEDDPDHDDISDIIGDAEHQIDEERANRIRELEERLGQLRPDLAELYAKNRRLIVGSKNRAAFERVKAEYDELATEYLRLKAKESYAENEAANREQLQARFDEIKADIEDQVLEFAGGDLENTDKTPEEIETQRQQLIDAATEALRQEYGDQAEALKTQVNTDVLEEFISQENELWSETNDRLDNGSVFRKAVSKIITNKYLKGILAGAAVAGLAVTGVGLVAGLAAGTTAVSFGLGAGTAIGAAKGAFSGLVMSRQGSESSALNAVDAETRSQNIREQLEGIDFLAENDDTKNAVGWMLEQYEEAKNIDRASNAKRTAISAGLGALAGAVAGSVQIGSNVTTETTTQQPTGEYEPTQYDFSSVENTYHQAGTGGENYFVNETGLVDSPAEYYKPGGLHELWLQHGAEHGLVEGSNGGWTYEGVLGNWGVNEAQSTAQTVMRETLQDAAGRGLINVQAIGGGQPIFNTVTNAVTEFVPDLFRSILNWATVNVGFDAIVGIATDRGSRAPDIDAPAITPPATEPEEEPDETPEETSEAASDAPTEPILPTPNNVPEPAQPAPEAPSEPEPPTQPETPPTQPETPPEAPELLINVNQAPETNNQTPPTPEENQLDGIYREQMRNRFGNLVGEEGVNFIAAPNTGGNDLEQAVQIARWWNTLPDEAKTAVRDFEATQENSEYGRALRLFLNTNARQGQS